MNDLIINNLEFAQSHQTLLSEVKVLNCERLAELLTPNLNDAQIRFELTGAAKQLRNPSLKLHIDAQLPVICQRCLDEMQVQLSLDFTYLVCQTLPIETDENDETDWLEATADMNLQDLIEDELLLAMPVAPMHAHDCSKQSMQSGEKPNPFAVLKGLVR